MAVVLEAGAGVGAGLGTQRLAVVIEALDVDVVIAPVLLAVGIPRHHETAARQACRRRLVLVAGRAGIDQNGLADLQSVGIIALAEHPVTVAIGTAAVGPQDDEAATGEAGHHRLDLVVRRVVVGLELVADRHALRVIALTVDTVAPAILRLRSPHRDVTAVGQTRHRRSALLARRVGVDHLLSKQRLRAVIFGRHLDGQHTRHARPARAIADLDGHRARLDRVRYRVAIGQILDHRLDGRRSGTGVEGDDEVTSRHAVGGDGADRHATIADRAARDADLAGTATLVANTERILRFGLLYQLRLLDVAVT